ncbi:hypothetical protein [Paraflavitalea sp. CAU 1676]|uniref:hypothetical protein n=1 Tax=Paraflavitalea sp. CAU 1676 TaxID=3032598 RepID=UPI0023D9D295|nr:hypothetical protein [Paraflavitalea sp. CAU 1676]MDF2187039.1 hypothetical protein [Paraflavitalea sp. CAU 1676]
MTTNLRKLSLQRALLLTGAVTLSLMISSCGDGGPKGDGVWIPTPVDSSALGVRDHFIPKDSIAAYRKRFDADRDTLAKLMPSLFIPFSEAFNKKSVLDLMKDSNCIGIRVYYGATAINSKGRQDLRLILVGVDKKGNDLFVRKSSGAEAPSLGSGGEGGFEYGQCAPPCDGDSSNR